MKSHGNMPIFVNWLKQHGGHQLPGWSDKINIVGIRNEADQHKDIFNDVIMLVIGNEIYTYTGTTDPGKYWTENAKKQWGVPGVAHLMKGWYPETYKIGLHMGKEALVQTGGPVTVWRDVNENFQYDTDIDEIQTGYFAINIHYTKNGPILIGRWSGGCQVIQKEKDWIHFFNIVKYSGVKKFNYLLIDIDDLDQKYQQQFFC